MNIALVWPKSTFLSDPMTWPPLGLWYLAAQLEAQGHKTDFFDLHIDALPEDGSYDQLWLSATSPQIFEVRKIADITKNWTKTKTVFGGAAPWANPKTALELPFDLIVSGESDHPDTVRKIVEEAENPSQKHMIVNISKNLDWVLPPVRRWSKNYYSYMKDQDGNKYRMASLFTCHDDKTEVLTENGFKLFKDVLMSENLLTYNLKTGIIEHKPIIRITKDFYVGDLIHFNSSVMDCMVTPNHRMIVQNRDTRTDTYGPPHFELANETAKKSIRRFIRFGKWIGYDPQIDVIEFKTGNHQKNTLKIDLLDFVEFLGYYISEGNSWVNKNLQYRVKISQSKKANPVTYSHIEECIKRMGFGYYKTDFQFEISCKELYEYLKPLGLCNEKYVPSYYKTLPKLYLQKLFDALQEGDGYCNKSGNNIVYHYTTTSKQLASDVQEISLKLGYGSSVHNKLSHFGFIRGRKVTSKNQAYTVTTYKSTHFISQGFKDVRRVQYNGYVYCAETENDTLITRRNGKVIVSGNSRGCPMECSFCESGRHGVIWDRLTRYEPLYIVEQQIQEIKDLGFTGLGYYDDIFIVNKPRTLKLLELHQKYNMVYRCFMRSDILCKHGGKDYLKQMKDAGLIEIFVGVESASNEIKNNIHKGTTIEQDTSVLQWCKELGITCKMSFILGLPGESLESMNRTRDWILKNRPHITQVDRLIPFPGTPLTKHPEEYDLKYETQIDDEWFFRGRHDINSKSFVSTSHLTVEDIDKFWHFLDQELIDEGLSGYNH